MRVPFLILCLAVAYGACRIHGEENVDLAEELENYNGEFNEDYNNDHKLNHANIPFEKSLSRHRRASLLSSLIPSIKSPITSPTKSPITSLITSPITSPITFPLTSGITSGITSTITSAITSPLKILGLSKIASPVLDFTNFVINALSGKDVCPKVEKLSDLITKPVTNPITTTKNIICKVLQAIAVPVRPIVQKLFKVVSPVFSHMFWKLFLPGMHSTLNALDKTGLLPTQISLMIKTFNVFYGVLRLMGKVP